MTIPSHFLQCEYQTVFTLRKVTQMSVYNILLARVIKLTLIEYVIKF